MRDLITFAIEIDAPTRYKLLHRHITRIVFPVRFRLGQRDIDIAHSDDFREVMNIGALEPLRISAAVLPLVKLMNDGREKWKLVSDRIDNIHGIIDVSLDRRELFVCELDGLGKNGGIDTSHPDIAEKRTERQRKDPLVRITAREAYLNREYAHVEAVCCERALSFLKANRLSQKGIRRFAQLYCLRQRRNETLQIDFFAVTPLLIDIVEMRQKFDVQRVGKLLIFPVLPRFPGLLTVCRRSAETVSVRRKRELQTPGTYPRRLTGLRFCLKIHRMRRFPTLEA